MPRLPDGQRADAAQVEERLLPHAEVVLRPGARDPLLHLPRARVEHAPIRAGSVLRFGDCIGVVLNVDPEVDKLAFAMLAPGLWGGPTLASAVQQAKTAASTSVPIVLVGETGTGKERVARGLHHWSGRSGPFNAINCSTVPAGLAEAPAKLPLPQIANDDDLDGPVAQAASE